MKKLLQVIALATGLVIGSPVLANSPTSVFAGCMVDTLNGKERKNLAKWIFLSMTAHPVIKPFSNAGAKDINESDQYIGRLITRLLTVDCPNELKMANKSDPKAIEKAFKLVGEIAMQEIMSHQETMSALTNYINYADKDKINKILSE